MATTAADVLIDTIMDLNVDTVFGLPGDGINELSRRYAKDRRTLFHPGAP
jgi:thiamine pyrophosphate-dependent acetolactate synthase large subunit-like protein